MIDLSTWKVTLPTNPVKEVFAKNLSSLLNNYFYLDDINGLQLLCPSNGGKTPNAKYPRCELRETIDPNDDNKLWQVGLELHTLNVELYVTEMPSSKKMIIAQVHGTDRPLLKVQVEKTSLYLIYKRYNGDNIKVKLLDKASHYAGLSIQIDVDLQGVFVTVNDKTDFQFWSDLGNMWENDSFYFKTGCYPQDNTGTEASGVIITKLHTIHTISQEDKINYIYDAVKRIEKHFNI